MIIPPYQYYALDRLTDVSGVSGTGRVAYVIDMPPGGGVLILWATQWPGIEWLPSLTDVAEVHCYGGKTKLVNLADDPAGHAAGERLLQAAYPRLRSLADILTSYVAHGVRG